MFFILLLIHISLAHQQSNLYLVIKNYLLSLDF